jgi:hypothetical protein
MATKDGNQKQESSQMNASRNGSRSELPTKGQAPRSDTKLTLNRKATGPRSAIGKKKTVLQKRDQIRHILRGYDTRGRVSRRVRIPAERTLESKTARR